VATFSTVIGVSACVYAVIATTGSFTVALTTRKFHTTSILTGFIVSAFAATISTVVGVLLGIYTESVTDLARTG